MKTDLPHIPEFRPAPWCLNGHLHTIGRSLFSNGGDPYQQRVEISTPDDDFLDLDIINTSADRPVVVLFHGLEGSSKRYYLTELARRFARKKYNVIGVNFRSCSGRMNRRRRFYHSGETGDMETIFCWVKTQFTKAPIGAVGFSLGGNALLKSLGEFKYDHPVNVAVAVSVPYDLEFGAQHISEGFNRIYEYNFIRTMKHKLRKKHKIYPDLPEFNGTTLYGYDDKVTAPIHGFEDAEDYYTSCSAHHFINDICRPTLLIHSRQDPICPGEMIPEKQIEANDCLSYIITEEGGHVGFWSRPQGWLNKTIMNFFEQNFDI